MAPLNIGQVGGLFQKLLKTGVGQVGEIYRNLQGIGPTALNPLATRTPTTFLGNVGKALNPLNPANILYNSANLILTNALPEGQLKRDLETSLYTPGNLQAKLASAILLSTPDAGASSEKETEAIRQSLARGGKQIGAKNTQGKYWAGENWAYQSPESFNKIFGTKLDTGRASPPLTQNFPSNSGAGSMLQSRTNTDIPSTTQHPGSSQQERAYREAAINTAQQTAQNPLFQKYRVADLTKQYNEAKTLEEKQNVGMQIWAQTNPLLAAKLKSGQTGYAQAQAAPGMSNAQGALLGGVPMPTANFNFATDVAPAFTTQQTFGDVIPGPGMVSATPMIANNANLFGSGLSEMPAGINSTQAFQAAAAMPAGFDPAAVNISPDQRKALIQQYLRGLK